MKCAFEDENGVCHGRYRGYKCIEESCELYGKFPVLEGRCVFYDNGYCKKLGIFDCDGKNKSCKYYREYLEYEIP
ncbi:MAG: hypothetical protein ACP5RZ_03655 [Thermoplasmata archaeon]